MSQSLPTPLLFISHKHADSKIADVIRNFVTQQSAGHIHVYQSSSPWANNPKCGNDLNKELVNALWKASALILVYSGADQDWSYCMWEAGVALNPASPDTKIILFQCVGARPPVFQDQVNVNLRELAEVQKFTNEFLTDPSFIPRLNEPITRFSPNGQEVATAAARFFQELSGVLPEENQPSIEWPAYPYLQLSLDLCYTVGFRELEEPARMQVIQQKCMVVDTDRYCQQLFEVFAFSPDTNLGQLAERWRDRHPESQSQWAEDLSRQIAAAAMWDFPPPVSTCMEAHGKTFAPVLTRVRKVPTRGCMQFDVYFDRFDFPAEVAGAQPRPGSEKPLQAVH